MPIVDLYSSRRKQADRAVDVWTYDKIPDVLRVQVSNIVKRALGDSDQFSEHSSGPIYQFVAREIAHEHGMESLGHERSAVANVLEYFKSGYDLDTWLDCVELSLRCVERFRGDFDETKRRYAGIEISAEEAVAETNERFRRAGFGYRYYDGKIFKIDNEYAHSEITKPALEFLSDPRFKGANEEFRAAHDHFKASEFRDCAVDALNAVESTMKSICDAKGWKYEKGSRASDLIKILRKHNLFPEFADQSFEQLFATLKSGLPPLRNETGAHGQGTSPIQIPEYVAAYALHLAASKILFLKGAFDEKE